MTSHLNYVLPMDTKPTYCPYYKDCLFQDKCLSVLPDKYKDNLAAAIVKLDVFAAKPLCHSDYTK